MQPLSRKQRFRDRDNKIRCCIELVGKIVYATTKKLDVNIPTLYNNKYSVHAANEADIAGRVFVIHKSQHIH